VAIYRLLQNSAFEPIDIARMTTAYEKALILLGLKDRNDPLTELVAKHVIEIAQTGERDFEAICTKAIELMRGADREGRVGAFHEKQGGHTESAGCPSSVRRRDAKSL